MTVTFPLTFNSQCFTVVGCDAIQSTTDKDGVDLAVYVSDFGTTEFRVSISDDRSTMSYVAFGVQQWGIVTDSSNGNQTRRFDFPVSFSNTDYSVVVASSYTEITSYGWGYINTKTTTYVTARVAGYTTHYIVVGKQQWGECKNSSQVTFPVQYTSTPLSFWQNAKSYTGVAAPGSDITSPKNLNTNGFTMGFWGSQWNGIVHWWICLGR